MKKDRVKFEIYDVITWLTNNSNVHIVIQLKCTYSRSKGNQTMKFDQLIEHNMWNIFDEK